MSDVKLDLEVEALLVPGKTQTKELEGAIRKALSSITLPKVDLVPDISIGANPANRAQLKRQLKKSIEVLGAAIAGDLDQIEGIISKATKEKLKKSEKSVLQTVKASYEQIAAALAQPLPQKFRGSSFVKQVEGILGDPRAFDKMGDAQKKRILSYVEFLRSQTAQMQQVVNNMNSLKRMDFMTGQLGSPISMPDLSADLRRIKEFNSELTKITSAAQINKRADLDKKQEEKDEEARRQRWRARLAERRAERETERRESQTEAEKTARAIADIEAKRRTAEADQRARDRNDGAKFQATSERWIYDAVAEERMRAANQRQAERQAIAAKEQRETDRLAKEQRDRDVQNIRWQADAEAKARLDAANKRVQSAKAEREEEERREVERQQRVQRFGELRHSQRLLSSVGGLGNVQNLGIGDQKLVQEDLKSQIKQLIERQRELGQAGKENTTVYARQAKRIKELGDALERSKASVADAAKQARLNANAMRDEGKAAETSADALRRRELALDAAAAKHGAQLIKDAGGLGRVGTIDRADQGFVQGALKGEIDSLTSKQRELVASGQQNTKVYKDNRKELDNLRVALRDSAASMSDFGTASQQTGALVRQFFRYALGYGALYQVMAAVGALTRGLVDLDKELFSIQAVAQATDAQMVLIESAIKKVAQATKFSVNEIAQAAKTLAQAGVNPDDMNSTLAATAAFAAATESSIEVSADLLSTMRNVFRELDDLTIANQLTRAVNISKLSADDLKTILSLSAQVAQDYNLSSEQYLAAVTTLRNAGIKASTTATGLRQAILEMFNPDTKTVNALKARYKELGEDLMDETAIRDRFYGFTQASNPLVAALRELDRLGFNGGGKQTFGRAFDTRAENVISAMIDQIQELESSASSITLGNAALTASETQMRSLANSIENLQGAFLNMADSLVGDTLPVIEDFIDLLSDGVQKVTELNDELRSSTGSGLGSSLGAGVLGAAAGALSTKGTLRRIGAGAAGAVAGTSISAAAETGGVGAAAAVVGTLFAVMDILGRIKGLRGGATAVQTAASAGAAVEATSTMLRGMATWGGRALGLVKGLGRLTGLGTAAFLAVEAVQAVMSFFEDNSEVLTQLKSAALASKERTHVAVQNYRDKILELESIRPETDQQAAGQGSSAESLEGLKRSMTQVNLDMMAFFGAKTSDVEALSAAVARLSESGRREAGSEARMGVITELANLSGVTADYLKKNDFLLSSMADSLGANAESVRKFSEETVGMLQRAGETLEAGGELDEASRQMVLIWKRWQTEGSVEYRKLVGLSSATTGEILSVISGLQSEAYANAKVEVEKSKAEAEKLLTGMLENLRAALISGQDPQQIEADVASIAAQMRGLGDDTDTVVSRLDSFISGVRAEMQKAVTDVSTGMRLVNDMRNRGITLSKGAPNGLPEAFSQRAAAAPRYLMLAQKSMENEDAADAAKRNRGTQLQARNFQEYSRSFEGRNLPASAQSTLASVQSKVAAGQPLVTKAKDGEYVETREMAELRKLSEGYVLEATRLKEEQKKLSQVVTENYDAQVALIDIDRQMAEAKRKGADITGLIEKKKATQLSLIDAQIAVEMSKRDDAQGDAVKLKESDNSLIKLNLQKYQIESQAAQEATDASREFAARRGELRAKQLANELFIAERQLQLAIAEGDPAEASRLTDRRKQLVLQQIDMEAKKLATSGSSAEEIEEELKQRRILAEEIRLTASDMSKLREQQRRVLDQINLDGFSGGDEEQAYQKGKGVTPSNEAVANAVDTKLRGLQELRAGIQADLAQEQAAKAAGRYYDPAQMTQLQDQLRSINSEIGTLNSQSENLHSTWQDTWNTATDLDNIRSRLQGISGTAADLGMTIQNSLVGGIDGMADAITGAVLGVEDLGTATKRVFAQMLQQIAAAILKQTLLNAVISMMGGSSGGQSSTGSLVGLAANLAVGYFTGGAGAAAGSATYTGAYGFAEGTGEVGTGSRSPGGMISGPGTGTSDSVAALAVGPQAVTPIRVAAGEAILTERVAESLGRHTIEKWNKAGVARMATGGVVGGKRDEGTRGGGGAPIMVNATANVESRGDESEEDRKTTADLIKKMLEKKISDALMEEQRPGGILNRQGNRSST